MTGGNVKTVCGWVSAMALLGLAACGGAASPEAASVPASAVVEPEAAPQVPVSQTELVSAPSTSETDGHSVHNLVVLDLPTTNTPADAAGVPVVALHGLGDSPKNFQRLFSGVSTARVVYLPEAPTAYADGFTWFSLRLRSAPPDAITSEIRAVAARVALLCRELARDTGKKPVITGFSQGAVVAFAVAVEHPDTVSLSLPVAGWLPLQMVPDKAPAGAPAIHALHGTLDDRLPFDEAKSVVDKLSAAGFSATLGAYDGVGHGLDQRMRTDLAARIDAAL